jgi:GT2 family glycosyltransferase
MKILHVIFSTNRLKYLTKSIESLEKLDYGSHEVHRLIVDDYPKTRNNSLFQFLEKVNGFKCKLNPINLGLSVNWSEFFDWLDTQDYDYVLHQEDDVLLTETIKIDDLIAILESDDKMASVVLQRQPWYFHEQPTKVEENDISWNNGQYYLYKNTKTFPIIFSFYRSNITKYPFREYWKFNLNEGMIMVYLDFFHQMYSGMLKNCKGGHLIEHIGEESIGKRVLVGEPNWEQFAHIHPDVPHNSRDGNPINN